jgi:hypothetical protein
MICVRINEGLEPRPSRLGERNRRCKYWPPGEGQEITVRVFADQAMMLGSAGIFMETMMPMRRDRQKPGEKPHHCGQSGNQPPETPQF